jgi:tyrosinase
MTVTVVGIHGLPLVHWDEQTEPQRRGVGYCTHGSVLFPTWHRPYVLLYEVSGLESST